MVMSGMGGWGNKWMRSLFMRGPIADVSLSDNRLIGALRSCPFPLWPPTFGRVPTSQFSSARLCHTLTSSQASGGSSTVQPSSRHEQRICAT